MPIYYPPVYVWFNIPSLKKIRSSSFKVLPKSKKCLEIHRPYLRAKNLTNVDVSLRCKQKTNGRKKRSTQTRIYMDNKVRPVWQNVII